MSYTYVASPADGVLGCFGFSVLRLGFRIYLACSYIYIYIYLLCERPFDGQTTGKGAQIFQDKSFACEPQASRANERSFHC